MVIRGDRSVRGDEAVAGSRENVARLCCWVSTSVNRVVDHLVVGCGHDDG